MGNVYWITGLSGAGKTTVGIKLYNYLKAKNSCVIRLDGDNLRQVFDSYDYSYEGRKNLGYQYARLCKMLSEQGVDVVICAMVMYDEIRSWNRENISGYREIFLDVDIEELIKRDQKGLYSKAITGKTENVVGINLDLELPKNPDLIIHNFGDITPEIALREIISFFNI